MRSGRLTTPVTVKRPTASRDAYGHDSLTYADLYDPLMVAVNTSRTATVDEADGVSGRQAVTFTAAYVSGLDVQPRDRIVWDGDTFEVETSLDRAGLRQWVDITAVRLAR